MELTAEQLARIEENRQKALQKRQLAAEKEKEVLRQQQLQDSIDQQDKAESAEKKTTESLTCACVVEEGDVCGKSPVDEVLYQVFDECVCKSCKKKTIMYDLISKSDCTSKYLLPEDAIKIMKFHTKDNPHNPGWTPMKLFLRKNAISMAIRRFGSEENLEKEKKIREEKKFQRGLEKAEDILSNTAEEYRMALDASTLSNGSLSASLEEGIIVKRLVGGGGISGIGSNVSSSSSTVTHRLQADITATEITAGKRKGGNSSSKHAAAAKKKKLLLDIAATIRGDD